MDELGLNSMIYLIIQLILALSLWSTPKSPEDFRWQKRILVSFDVNGFDTEFISIHQKEIRERKLLLVHLVEEELLWSNSEESLDTTGFEDLRSRIRPTSSWVLIGLDGGVKSQGGSQIPMEEIFRLIDSMPMRQSEMRGKNGKDGI